MKSLLLVIILVTSPLILFAEEGMKRGCVCEFEVGLSDHPDSAEIATVEVKGSPAAWAEGTAFEHTTIVNYQCFTKFNQSDIRRVYKLKSLTCSYY